MKVFIDRENSLFVSIIYRGVYEERIVGGVFIARELFLHTLVYSFCIPEL